LKCHCTPDEYPLPSPPVIGDCMDLAKGVRDKVILLAHRVHESIFRGWELTGTVPHRRGPDCGEAQSPVYNLSTLPGALRRCRSAVYHAFMKGNSKIKWVMRNSFSGLRELMDTPGLPWQGSMDFANWCSNRHQSCSGWVSEERGELREGGAFRLYRQGTDSEQCLAAYRGRDPELRWAGAGITDRPTETGTCESSLVADEGRTVKIMNLSSLVVC
jgi:hypothetical protein